jgi:hypothetical protein
MPSPQLRDAVRQYVSDGKSTLKAIRKLGSPAEKAYLHPIIDMLLALDERWDAECYPALNRLLMAISAKSPASGLIHNPEVMAATLKSLGTGTAVTNSPDLLSQLSNSCPCLLDLLRSDLCAPSSSFSQWLRPLLTSMGDLAFKFAESEHVLCRC